MSDTHDSLLGEVALEVLGDLAFLLPACEEAPAAATASQQMWARVRFAGPFGGTLYLGADSGVVTELASNMLGLEEMPTPGQQADAMAEALNVICGNLLPRLGSPAAVFDVNSPCLLTAPPPAGASQVGQAELAFDSGQAILLLCLDAATAAPTGGTSG